MDEMIRVTTSFLRGEVAASNHERKNSFLLWKQQERNQKQNFRKGSFQNQQRPKRKQDRFTLLTKTPKEIFALEKGKFKAPPPMTTPIENRNHTKFCKFHGEVGHNTDEYEDEGTEGPMIIKAKIGGHFIHRMYVDGERKLQAVPSTTHEMLKLPVEGGIITLKSNRLVPLEYVLVSGPEETPQAPKPVVEKRVKPVDMTDVLRHIAKHHLNVRKGCSSVRQKKRGLVADRNQAIQEEVEKLIEAGIMKEVHYHDWLSNLVMVKKHDDNWRMCVDFKDLNKACPKDGYPLPEINWKIGRNLEVYVDDLFIKSHMKYAIVRDIEETFKTLREINMKLNPKKCTFRVKERMFLSYKVNAKGLKVCPDKVDSVLSLPSPKCLKDVQKLNEKLTSLNRFLAKSAEKSLPFFKTLKKCTKKSNFHWTKEAKEAFKQMKMLIAELPILTAPMEKEKLIVYLAATKETVSAVLVTEREAKQMPIYFVSSTLRGPKINYTSMEKLVLALVHANGSSCTNGSGAGLILTNPEGMEFTYALRFMFDATNNEAEYEALITGLPNRYDLRLTALAFFTSAGRVSSLRYLKIRVIQDCHVHKPIPRNPQQTITPITSPWPFYKWGIDIVRPFPEEPGKVKFLIVVVDYFTNFGLPGEIISDNGKQFRDNPFKDWCEKLCIRQHFASVKHPQTNGLVERANHSLGEGIKVRDTPFSLTYGMEAVIPTEIGMATLRTLEVDLVQNNEALGINLDLLEERKEEASIRKAKSKARMEKYYNSKVKNTSFKRRGLVYQNNDASRTEDTKKLGPK
nr:reverse transcriptase domain-containing protein [Tanacetum cinerariifolium]